MRDELKMQHAMWAAFFVASRRDCMASWLELFPGCFTAYVPACGANAPGAEDGIAPIALCASVCSNDGHHCFHMPMLRKHKNILLHSLLNSLYLSNHAINLPNLTFVPLRKGNWLRPCAPTSHACAL